MVKNDTDFDEKVYTAAHNAKRQLENVLYLYLTLDSDSLIKSDSYIKLLSELKKLEKYKNRKVRAKPFHKLTTSKTSLLSRSLTKKNIFDSSEAKKLAEYIENECDTSKKYLEIALDNEGDNHLKVVEVFGAAGTGKSSTLKELGKLWSNHDKWILDHNYSDYCDWPSKKGSGYDYLKDNVYFASLIHQIIENRKRFSPEHDIKKHLQHERIYRVFNKLGKAKRHNVQKSLVLDEGIIKHCGLALRTSLSKKEQARFLNLKQMPHAYIFFDTEINIMVERIQNRKKNNRTHESRDAAYLSNRLAKLSKCSRLTAEIISDLGIPVLHIDAALPPEENALLIKKFLDEQCS